MQREQYAFQLCFGCPLRLSVMATIHQPPASLDAALAMLPSLPRPMLSRLVTRMIERLDEIDGDPEVEEDNEDCGHDDAEPDYRRPHWRIRKWAGPDCMFSDTDYGGEEPGEPENCGQHPGYGIDQSLGPLSPGMV